MQEKMFEYIVVPGDTLYDIALRFNVPLARIKELNPMENYDAIVPGQKILIPVSEEFYNIAQLVRSQCERSVQSSTETSAASSAQEPIQEVQSSKIQYRRYSMRRGDTLFMLAKQNNTTVANILALNPDITDVRNIPVGKVITIPVSPENAFIYTVRPGDTVYSIAASQGTTVEKIMEYNYIERDYTIYPGQQLVIVR